ncbi:MAG: hypothetical protein HQK66_01440 [Desulfamplus sp.]|nr:hypothetical protein [Desulfamplus sp.]
MNDFLQSLRGGTQKDKRMPKTRRAVDNENHYGSTPGFHGHGNYQGTRAGNVKRSGHSTGHSPMTGVEPQTQSSGVSIDPVDIIAELLEVYNRNQEILTGIEERRVLVEERKAIALEEIAEYIRVATSSSTLQHLLTAKPDGDEDIDHREHFSRHKEIVDTSDFVKVADTADPGGVTSSMESRKNEKESNLLGGGSVPQDDVRDWTSPLSFSGDEDFSGGDVDDLSEKGVESHGKSSERLVVKKDSPDVVVKVIKRKKPVEKTENVSVGIGEDGIGEDGSESYRSDILSREEIMSIISSMRKSGATFDQVAQHLVELKQPTFSGRGEWHAQTIHRLCRKYNIDKSSGQLEDTIFRDRET